MTEGERVETILFDVMNTLVVDPFPDKFLEFFNLRWEEFIERKNLHVWEDFECDRISEEQFYQDFFNDNDSVNGESLRESLYESYVWVDGMENLLCELDSDSLEIHAFSNYPIWFNMIEEKLQLSRFLDWTFVSHKTKIRKPSPEAYDNVIQTLNCSGKELLFVDNKQENVEGAEEFEFQTHHFQDVDLLRSDLKSRDLL